MNLNPVSPLAVAVLLPTVLVIVAVVAVLWRERASSRDTPVAIAAGIVLTGWAISETVLARRGVFQPAADATVPPVGVNLIVVLLGLTVGLSVSPSLRRLLRDQASLIRLHLWRLEGFVFLALMLQFRVPALWALPAGLGDILVAATAPWVARGLERPENRPRAIAWTLFGMADLVVAVTLGVMTNPGPTQVFYSIPDARMLTQYPLALVPTFLVPVAFTLHVVTLWQLRRGSRGE
jgi:hypothetical protein